MFLNIGITITCMYIISVVTDHNARVKYQNRHKVPVQKKGIYLEFHKIAQIIISGNVRL